MLQARPNQQSRFSCGQSHHGQVLSPHRDILGSAQLLSPHRQHRAWHRVRVQWLLTDGNLRMGCRQPCSLGWGGPAVYEESYLCGQALGAGHIHLQQLSIQTILWKDLRVPTVQVRSPGL